jgi:parallel beta-helix repeat protein
MKLIVILLPAIILQTPAFGQGATAPPGPPAPTMKTLAQVEPRTPITNLPVTISVAGSYYMTTNLTGNPGGITIAASGVTLDLMGFELVGGTGSGVNVSGNRTNIVIRNGTVRGWGDEGVSADIATDTTFEGLRILGNASNGLRAGNQARVTGCIAANNSGVGISAVFASTISDCLAVSNSNRGIDVASGCTVIGSASRANGSFGIDAFQFCTIVNCASSSNSQTGINADIGSTIIGCSSGFNSGGGGIFASSGSTIRDCTARGNQNVGIRAGEGSTVNDCTVSGNTGDGIVVSNRCHLTGNTCNNNGAGTGDGAGVHATGSGNRIDGNNVTINDRGIEANSAGNLIIRNSASGNGSNYVFGGTQSFGPTNTVSGIVTNHPWANFSF